MADIKLSLKELEQIKKNYRLYLPKNLYPDAKLLFDYINSLEKALRMTKVEEAKKQTPLFGDGLAKWQIDLAILYEKHDHSGPFIKYYKAIGLTPNDAEYQAKKAIIALKKIK